MYRTLAMAAASLFVIAGAGHADPIEGSWKTQSGDNATISSCGSSFCIKLTSGEYAGKAIGKMAASGGGKYTGSITKPSNGKTYSGSARLSGASLKMTGCVLAVLCETQTWQKM